MGQGTDDISVAPFRLFPLLPRKRRMSEPELELGKKVVWRQEPLELIPFGAVGIEHLDRRRPLSTEALKCLRLFFDVDLYGQEIVLDEGLDARVGIHLGIQPSASPSHWSGIEIQQQGALASRCFGKCGIDISTPCNRHKLLLSNGQSY